MLILYSIKVLTNESILQECFRRARGVNRRDAAFSRRTIDETSRVEHLRSVPGSDAFQKHAERYGYEPVHDDRRPESGVEDPL